MLVHTRGRGPNEGANAWHLRAYPGASNKWLWYILCLVVSDVYGLLNCSTADLIKSHNILYFSEDYAFD